MPAPKPKWMPEPRGWTAAQVCAYIGMSVSWWQDRGEKLLKTKYGFPHPSPVTGRYDGKAVARWYDGHSGILATEVINDPSAAWRQGLDALEDGHGSSSQH
mgnify:CR=1 FL=1